MNKFGSPDIQGVSKLSADVEKFATRAYDALESFGNGPGSAYGGSEGALLETNNAGAWDALHLWYNTKLLPHVIRGKELNIIDPRIKEEVQMGVQALERLVEGPGVGYFFYVSSPVEKAGEVQQLMTNLKVALPPENNYMFSADIDHDPLNLPDSPFAADIFDPFGHRNIKKAANDPRTYLKAKLVVFTS